MSKVVKKMQLDTLKATFQGVRDLLLINIVGLDAVSDNTMRLDLRKKGIRMHMVKNSLAKKALGEMGLTINAGWEGATTLAWGGSSISELSKEIETYVKKHTKTVKVKLAVAEGQEVSFDAALKMPTKAEAIGRVVMLAMAPAARVAGAICGPAGIVAGQIKSLKDKKEEPAPVPAAS